MMLRTIREIRLMQSVSGRVLFVLFPITVLSPAKAWLVDQNSRVVQRPRTPADPQLASKIVALAIDTKASAEQRMRAYQDLCQFEAGDVQQQSFLEVLRRAPEDVAVYAAMSMLCEDSLVRNQVDRIVEDRLPSWSAGSQFLLLPPKLTCSQRKPDTLRFIPRAILRNLVESGRRGAVGISGLLLATSEEAQDKELLARTVLVGPEIYGLWWNVVEQRAVGPAQRELARAILQDPMYPFAPESQVKGTTRRLIRAAAATALSPDKAADDFAISEIRAFLSEFSTGEFNQSQLPTVMEGQFAERYYRYKSNLPLLGNLMYLQTPAAKDLTFKYLESADNIIRLTLSIVTARRWPERVLELDASLFANEYGGSTFDVLMAVLAYFHPELEQAAMARGSSQVILRILSGLRDGVLWGLHGEAGVVVGGW